MHWLITLPALLLILTAPLMFLLILDALTRHYADQEVRVRDSGDEGLILTARPEQQGQAADRQERKAA